MVTTRKIGVGVIGANPTQGWAASTHLPAIAALDALELVAVATSNMESATASATQFSATRAYDDSESLIADDDVELVVVSVRIPDHYRYVRSAIEHGKHVLCEWPLGRDLAEATDLADRALARGVVHGIGLQGRKSPMIRYVRDLVTDGYVGEVRFADVKLVVRGAGSPEYAAGQAWTADRSNGYTTLSILGAHNLDIVRYILGDFAELQAIELVRSPAGFVTETGTEIPVSSPDVALIVGQLASGALATVSAQIGLAHGHGIRIEIAGNDGVIVLSDPLTLNFADGNATVLGARGDGPLESLVVPDRYRIVPAEVPDTWASNVAGIYLEMAGAITRSEPAPEPNFHTAVELHRFLETVQLAAETGERQRVS